MRALMHLFSALLIPVSLFVAVLLTLYFTSEYTFTQAMKLGVLYGLFAGIIISLILAVAIIIRREQKEKNYNRLQNESLPNQNLEENINKFMLLMHKELIFEIILGIMKKNIPQAKISYHINKGNIHIQIDEEVITVAVTPLTRQASEVIINSIENSEHMQSIVSLLKEKEHTFLQY